MTNKALRTMTFALILCSLVLSSLPFTYEVGALRYGKNVTLDHADASFTGEVLDDRSGMATAMNGDLNGDGFGDIVISATSHDSGSLTENGKIYVIFGSKGGAGLVMDRPLSEHNASFVGETSNNMAAESLDISGDINGDGFDDLIMGVFHYGSRGQVYIIFGKATGWSKNLSLANADASYLGENPNDLLSRAVSVGDINGDGMDDLVMGADNSAANGSGSGKIYIIFGRTAGWSMDTALSDSTVDASMIGEGLNERFGTYISGAGDVNGDGLDDFLVGTTMHDEPGNRVDVGKSYLVLGRTTGWKDGMTVADANASWYGDYLSGWCGNVAGVGDVDADGYDDIIIGCPNNAEQGVDSGKSYLIYGKPFGWAKNQNISSADASFLAEGITNRLGLTISALGDVNCDEFADIGIGSPLYLNSAGKSYIIFGKSARFAKNTLISTAASSFIGETSNDGANHISGGSDVDGDGLNDMVVSSVGNSQSFSNAGQTYLLYPDHNLHPTSISTVKATKPSVCSQELFMALVNDTICIELQGTDSNASRNNVALVNVHNPSRPKFDFTMRLFETGAATGKFRGLLTIKDRTRESDNWVGAKVGDYIIVSDLNDPAKNATILVGQIPIQLRPLQDIRSLDEDSPYSVVYTAVGKNAATAWNFGTNAKWLNWGPTNHTLYGTPNNTAIGASWVRINVTDGLGNYDEHNFTLTVKNTPPVILTNDVLSSDQNKPYYVDYNSSDDGQGTVTWSWITNAAAWLNFDTDTGVLSGTALNQHVGIYSVNVTVNDGNGGTDSHAFTISVGNINDPPVIITVDVTSATEDEEYNVTYSAYDADTDSTINWSFNSNASWLNFNISSARLWGTPLNEHVGTYWVNITAQDDLGAKAVHNFTLTVMNVNDVPNITSTPINTTKVLYRYKYQVIAQDIDPGDKLQYCLAQAPPGMLIDQNTGLIEWLPNREQRGTNSVIIEVYDTNNSMAQQIFNLTVDVPAPTLLFPTDGRVITNLTPELVWTITYNGTEPIIYDIYLEPGTVPLTMIAEGINATNFTLLKPLKNGQDYSWFVIPRTGSIRADPSAIWHFRTDTGYVPMPKISIDLDRGDIRTLLGKNITVNVTIMNIGNVKGDVLIDLVTTLPKGSVTLANTTNLDPGASKTFQMTIRVPSMLLFGEYSITISAILGNSTVTKSIKVEVVETLTPPPKPEDPVGAMLKNPLFVGGLVLLIGLSLTGVLAFILSSRGRKKLQRELEAQKARAEEVEDFNIDEIFIIYHDGRLMTHVSNIGAHIDQDIFASMLVAIQSFIGDSVRPEAGCDTVAELSSFEYGSRKMILEKGKHIIIVVALSGTAPKTLKGHMQDLISKIEGLYAGIIEKWDGNKDSIQDLNPMLVPLFGIKEGMKIKKEKEEVKVSSGIEFFGGYVRLKVGIKNELTTEITEVMMNLTFDDRTLSLSHIEPEYPMKGKMVLLDPIGAGEKRTVAFYLDPLICQESNVDALVVFRDPYGHQGKAHMKRRPVDIVCPIFHTSENINVAMLKRLLGDVKYSDSRIFIMPESLDLRKAIDIAKEAVQRHDIKLIRELNQEKPQIIEAWYYGTTSETKEELILKVSICEEPRTLEAFVACSNLASMTGLLAEVSNGITSNFAMHGYGELKASTDEDLKERLTVGGRLVDKTSG